METIESTSTVPPSISSTDGLVKTEAPAPVHFLTDYIEVVYLPAAVCIGTILNVIVFLRLWKKWHRLDESSRLRRSYLLLKFNLNIADLMVLLIYAFGRFCWMVTFQWYGGRLLCRAYHFFSLIAFHMTAYVMVTIALERLKAVYSVVPLSQKKKRTNRFVRNMLAAGWALSVILSSGQWCVWDVFEPPFEVNFVQCTTIWEIGKVRNNTFGSDEMRENGGLSETAYMLIHLSTAYWIPLLVIVGSYMIICARYLKHVLAVSDRLQGNTTDSMDRCCSVSSTNGDQPRPTRTHSYSLVRQSRSRTTIHVQPHSPVVAVQCRSRVFRTSGLVILCYLCCWSPYNVLALWRVVYPSSFYPLGEQLNILNALIVLNSVFNPIIYGFN